MNLVVLSADLMVVSRVEGASARGGGAVKVAADVGAVVDQCRANDVGLVFVDLGSRGGEIAGLMEQLGSLEERRPRVVAFGPHVHEAVLAAAKAAGCDEVLSRGAFFSQVDEIVARRGQ